MTLKLQYLQNYTADSNLILRKDKHYQLLFVGGPTLATEIFVVNSVLFRVLHRPIPIQIV